MFLLGLPSKNKICYFFSIPFLSRLDNYSIGWDDGTISYGKADRRHSRFSPLRLCTEPNAESTVTMLLLENSQTSHWFFVKSISKLLRRKSSNCKEKYYCLRCFRGFMKKSGLKDHEIDCSNLSHSK